MDCNIRGEIGDALHARRDGTNVRLHADSLSVTMTVRLEVVTLLEGAALDTSATFTRGNRDCSSTSETAVVCKEFAVAAHAGVTSIKDW